MMKTTHELQVGDVIEAHGCRFELTFGSVDKSDSQLKYDTSGTAWFKTRLLTRSKDSPLREDWAEAWIVQGNKNASWRVVGRVVRDGQW
jgi:hypothetical protein